MQYRVYYIESPEAAVEHYAKTAESAAVTFLADHPRTDTSQITVESVPTSKRRSQICHYRACDLAQSEQFTAILAHRARQEAIEAQKREDEPRTAFRTKVSLIAVPTFGLIYLLLTGDWATILPMTWYLFVSTYVLANASGR